MNAGKHFHIECNVIDTWNKIMLNYRWRRGMQRNFHLQKRMANISASNAINYFPNGVMYIDIKICDPTVETPEKSLCCQNC